MKPTNIKSQGCDPVSSNCVIWQGPDLPCIDLCKGDSVSDVVFKVAVELCKLQDILTVTTGNYDLSCFNLTSCNPETFPQLLQFILDRLCAVEKCSNCVPDCNGNTPTPTTPTDGCPDCMMTIASCFQFTNGIGDTVTALQMKDYITAIGNKICTLAGNTVTNTSSINNLGGRVLNVESSVTTLQNTQYVPPTVTPVCVINPGSPTAMNVVLAALEQQFCALVSATGSSADIFTAITTQCPNLTTNNRLGGPGTMGEITGWVNTVQNLSDSITNMWLTICDLRSAVINIQENCCPKGCAGISLQVSANLSGSVITIYVSGTVPSNFIQCAPSGTATYTITDGNNLVRTYSGLQGYDIITYLNDPAGFPVDLSSSGLDLNTNLTIKMTPCFYDPTTDTTCESCLDYVLVSSVPCPAVICTSTLNTISYTAAVTSSMTANYTVNLYTASPAGFVASDSQLLTGPATLNGVFAGLTPNTNYKVQLVITTSQGTNECSWVLISTQPDPCPPISDASATIIVTPIT